MIDKIKHTSMTNVKIKHICNKGYVHYTNPFSKFTFVWPCAICNTNGSLESQYKPAELKIVEIQNVSQ